MAVSAKQFGHALFLESLGDGSTAKLLERVDLKIVAETGATHDEKLLQNLIMQHPSLLPVEQIEPVFTPLVPICRELPVSGKFLDNLLITPKGDIALVECKLWRSPQARREVIGQIIDYSSEMSKWSLEHLEGAVRHARRDKSENLYSLVSAGHETDLVQFNDAVSRNLRRGRFLLLVVGDGIREGVEPMAECLQHYAGSHFTFALVEVALYKLPTSGFVAQPRVLAKTTNIERGIVVVQDGRPAVRPPATGGGAATTFTQEGYHEELERQFEGVNANIQAFFDELAAHHVVPEFGSDTLILRWRPDEGTNWNLGTISRKGLLWLDYLGQQASAAGLLDEHERYIRAVAALVPEASVKETPKQTGWYITRNGRTAITVDALVGDPERRAGWIAAIVAFQAAALKASQPD